MERRGQILVILLALGFLFLVIPISTNQVQANPLTIVTLTLQEDPPHVDVSPGSPGVVTITGTVTCVKYGPDYVKVFLSASCETSDASVVPPSFVFTQQTGQEKTETFSVTTRIPEGYPCKATPAITVSGYFDQGGLRTNIAPVSQIIIIDQYYKIDAYCPEGNLQTVKPGENFNLDLYVINEGNGDDTFFIDIENRASLNNKGFGLSESVETTICENEVRVVMLQIAIPEKISGNFSIHLLVESIGAESSGDSCKYSAVVNLIIKTGNTTENNPVYEQVLSGDFSLRLIILSFIATSISITAAVIKRRRRATHPY
jgi:hypothetical protein